MYHRSSDETTPLPSTTSPKLRQVPIHGVD
jgi:hypothetical protein